MDNKLKIKLFTARILLIGKSSSENIQIMNTDFLLFCQEGFCICEGLYLYLIYSQNILEIGHNKNKAIIKPK